MSDNEENTIEFANMPGADAMDTENESLDMNFGLGEEVDETEPAEEVVEDAVEETEASAPEVEAETEELEVEQAAHDAPEEETDAEETVAEAAETAEPEVKRKMVPKSRLDEVLAKQKALQKQLDDMKAAQTPSEEAPEEYDFASKEVEYQNFLLDGEAEKAAALRSEMRKAERAQIEYEMTEKMNQTVNQNQQQGALQQAANELEANFPVFDANSDQYDEAMTQEVIELRDAFIIKGENAVAALSKAAKFVISEYSLVDTTETASALTADTAPPAKSDDEVAKKRAQVARKLKAAESQPPELPGESSATRGESSFDINALSEEEFDALPEATLKRLRGDII